MHVEALHVTYRSFGIEESHAPVTLACKFRDLLSKVQDGFSILDEFCSTIPSSAIWRSDAHFWKNAIIALHEPGFGSFLLDEKNHTQFKILALHFNLS
jgi:hypothetical protein